MGTIDQVGDLLEKVLSRVILETPRRLVAGGITVAQLRILRFLARERGASLREVAEALGISSSTASELVEKGVGDGYVQRVRKSSDRRVARLTLLPKEKRLLSALARERRDRVRQMLKRVDPQALGLARAALETLDRILTDSRPSGASRLKQPRRNRSDPRWE